MPSPKEVPKPEPAASVAAAQTKANIEQLKATQTAQNVAQNTPFGSLNYEQIGIGPNGIPMFRANTNLSPEQQAILTNIQNSQLGLGGAGGNLVNAAFDMYSTPPNFNEMASGPTSEFMNRQISYMTPFFDQQTEQLDNQLRNQGLTPGTEAYDRALRTLRDNQNQSMFSFLNQAQPLMFNQAREQYNQPLQTIGNIMGLTQPASLTGSFINAPRPSMGATDYIGANTAFNQANMQAYQAQLGRHNAMMGGLFNLGGNAMMLPFLL